MNTATTTKLTLSDIEAAAEHIYRHFGPTPTYTWPLLSKRAGCEVWVKHENHTPVGAFKIRGGINLIARLRAEQPCISGIISATRGNHGQSLAYAAGKVGLECVIVVPEGNSPGKNAAMQALGAELIVHGTDFQEAAEYADGLSISRGLKFIGPFHPWLVAGVATYALEFFKAQPDLDVVYAPIGMGSGVCGLIAARDALGLKTHIVGVVAEKAPAYALSFQQMKPVSTDTANTVADGVACRMPDPVAVDIILDGCADVVQVAEGAILDAMAHYFTDTHNVAESAAAVPLAALLNEKDKRQGQKVGLILSGGNADVSLMKDVLSRPV